MRTCTLIIVSGLPATGKTVLSHKLAQHVNLPLISKDIIKEILFDGVGHGDRAWGEKLNIPTYDLLDYFVEQELRAQHSLIIETPYDNDFRKARYTELQAKYSFMCIQVLCYAEPQVLIQRFIDRIGASDRHPGHNDTAALEDFKASIRQAGKVEPLPLHGQVYEIDTTDFTAINETDLFRQVKELVIESTLNDLRNLVGEKTSKLTALFNKK
ncbi:MAG TPA: AAA family ATPase [Candidatus Saccharimonadales bacterium]|nr:AAA family ATPase [Candidatus Saccharimonadales bacterium]